MKTIYTYSVLILVCLLLQVHILHAQTPRDTVPANQMITRAAEWVRQHQPDNAIPLAKEGIVLARKNSFLRGEAVGNRLLAEAYAQKKEYSDALRHYFSAVKAFDILKDNRQLIRLYSAVGSLYLEQDAYTQAVRYFELAYKRAEAAKSDASENIALLDNMVFASIQLEDYTQAIHYQTQLLDIYRQTSQKQKVIESYKALSSLSERTHQYRLAQKYNAELVTLYTASNDVAGLSSAYNNLGFICKRTDDLKAAVEYFNKVTELMNRQTKDLSDNDKAILYQNVGVAYTNLKQYTRARDQYTTARKIREKQKNEVEMASVDNYLASTYYVSGNTTRALKTVNDAIRVAEANRAEEVLETSYKILSLLYEKEDNPSRAQQYLEKHRALKDKLAKAEKQRKQQLLQKQLLIEQAEEDIRTLLAEQEREVLEAERRESELKLQQNEIALKAKELAIIKRDQELKAIEFKNQQLEKERTEQALALAQQQLEAEKRDRELSMLAKEKELQEQKLKRKSLEDEQQKKTIQLLEADKKLKDEQLTKGYWIVALFALVLTIIVISLLQKRKANRQLHRQQQEIQEKNVALQQNMTELNAAQQVLSEQKDQLEVQNKKITSSILYAQRIQQSILPPDSMMSKLFPEHFITYLPKDIVSGDFYWATERQGIKILSVVDCTGHGVPGALMSVVGSNSLSELVNQRNYTSPAAILNNLHASIRSKLSQEESQNHDGMDLGICSMERVDNTAVKVVFSGAKQTLYIMRGGVLEEVEGDRKSIGGANTGAQRDFSNHEVILTKGDILYMTTDGFTDQNDPERVRYNKKRFRNLITTVYHESMPKQRQLFEEALAAHRQHAEQRDDITVIAVKL
ncbi:MAG TPA: tetratricopeptide repeat protein [Ohtaekwangia sp.]|uniref:tetratricopeptide repeat protein n=1 Tax=Ohtaekwangia sp. TaxID=2066019 RepID=UPI002F94F076